MSSNIRQHKHIVIGAEHYNPLGIVRTLGENGISPVVIVIKNNRPITSQSTYIWTLHFVDSLDGGVDLLLNKYGNEVEKPFVYTSDDQAASRFDLMYDELKDKFYFFNAGKQGRLSFYMNKFNLCELAKKHGIPLAKTWVVNKGEIPNDIEYPIITKAIISTIDNWKNDSFICNDEEELRKAFTEIRSHQVLLQQYIKKANELCLDGLCVSKGDETFITIASKYNYLIPDTYSPYMKVFSLKDKNLSDKVASMFKEIGFEGIFSMEFLIGPRDELYFLEINFRNSTWSYASTCAGMPLPIIWAEGMLGNDISDRCREIQDPFNAMVEYDDFRYRVRNGKTSILRWWRDFRNCKCTYYYDVRDKAPFFSVIKSKIFKGRF